MLAVNALCSRRSYWTIACLAIALACSGSPAHCEEELTDQLIPASWVFAQAGDESRVGARSVDDPFLAAREAFRAGRIVDAQRSIDEVLRVADRKSGQAAVGLLNYLQVLTQAGDNVNESRLTQALVDRTDTSTGLMLYLLNRRLRQEVVRQDLRRARATLIELDRVYKSLESKYPASSYRDVWTLNAEFATAALAAAVGDHAQAIDAYKRALSARRQVKSEMNATNVFERGWHIAEDTIRRWMADALSEADRFVEAEALAREGVNYAVKTFGPGSVRTAFAQEGLARVLLQQGRVAEAELLVRASLDIHRRWARGGASANIMRCLSLQGRLLILQERWADAEKAYADWSQFVKGNKNLRNLTDGNNYLWAIALSRLGQHERALEQARILFHDRVARYPAKSYETAAARAVLASVQWRNGQSSAARHDFDDSLPILLDRRSADEAGEARSVWRTTFLRWILEDYLALLISGGGEVHTARALEYSDYARASLVQRAISASVARAQFQDQSLAEIARLEQTAGNRIRALNRALSEILARSGSGAPKERVEELAGEIEELRATRDRHVSQISLKYPQYAALLDPKPASLEQARALLGPNEALLSYYVANDRCLIWALRSDGRWRFAERSIGRQQLASLVRRLRRSLDLSNASERGIPAFDFRASNHLYQELVAPVESILAGADSLVIVPHGDLFQVNFSLLVAEPFTAGQGEALPFSDYRRARWLVRRFAVSQVPTLSAFQVLRQARPLAQGRSPFLGFGDPIFSLRTRSESAPRGGTRFRTLVPDREAGAARLSMRDLFSSLPGLPDTADEIRDVAVALGASASSDTRLGAAATESSVKKVDLSQYKVLAFATHGLVAGEVEGLTQPALVLTNPDISGEADADGLLSLDEVLSLRLDADWVVLSACNTAASDGRGGEAVSGLGQGFFFAGARAILVSNWAVETVSTRVLMTGLFSRYAKNDRIGRAEALRLSMTSLIDEGVATSTAKDGSFSYAHPIFWAPFSLVGDGRR